jgi:hypothetical protein
MLRTFFFWANNILEMPNENSLIKKEYIDDFMNMIHYWTLTVKRNSNDSGSIYKIFNLSKA